MYIRKEMCLLLSDLKANKGIKTCNHGQHRGGVGVERERKRGEREGKSTLQSFGPEQSPGLPATHRTVTSHKVRPPLKSNRSPKLRMYKI